MTEEELKKRSAPGGISSILASFRVPLAVLLGVAPVLAFGVYVISFVIGAIVAIGFYFGISSWNERRMRPFREEASYRAWRNSTGAQPTPEHLTRFTTERMASSDAPEWLLVLSGAVLPHGGAFFISAELHQYEGRIELRQRRLNRNTLGTRRLIDLDADQLQVLHDGLKPFPKDFTESPQAEVKDGVPCELRIFRRDPANNATLTCNLAGPQDSHTKDFCRTLYEIATRSMASRQSFGTSDPSGNITLGTI